MVQAFLPLSHSLMTFISLAESNVFLCLFVIESMMQITNFPIESTDFVETTSISKSRVQMLLGRPINETLIVHL